MQLRVVFSKSLGTLKYNDDTIIITSLYAQIKTGEKICLSKAAFASLLSNKQIYLDAISTFITSTVPDTVFGVKSYLLQQ